MSAQRHLHIVWLYHDLMNLYGDRGNILTLAYRATQRGIAARVTGVSLNQPIPPDVDILFFGGGQDQEQLVVSKDLPSKKEALEKFVQQGGALLSVCGGYQLLGSYYQPLDGEKIPGLGILPIYTIAGKRRMIGDLVVTPTKALKTPPLTDDLIGFENHSGMTYLEKGVEALGNVRIGNGNNSKDKKEGVVFKNAIGTYLHGPLLPKNPQLADFLIRAGLAKHGDVEPLSTLKRDTIDVARQMALVRAKNRKTSSLGLRS